MTQISKEELYAFFHSSKYVGISKIKKWFINGQLKILENVLGDTIQEKVFNLLFPEKSKGCEICKKPTSFISLKKGFYSTCSKSCAMKKRWLETTPELEFKRQNQRSRTNLEKYGVDNAMKNKNVSIKISIAAENKSIDLKNQITNKRKLTNLEKYGVEFAQQLTETKEKAKMTCLKKYGVTNPSLNGYSKLKRKNTILEKFGVENAFQSFEIQNKIKKTNLLKFGVENPSQSPIIMDKKIVTHLKNYGVGFPAQHLETFEKQQKNAYKRKEIILPSGKKILLQGHEPYALLNDLLLIYNEDEIIIGNKHMPEIWYVDRDNKKHRYFPDFYIPKEKKIIEVKSVYTMKIHLEKNFLKKARCLELGFDFEFKIYDNKMNLIDEKEFL